MTDTTPRYNLCKSDCEVRDDRWSFHIDAGDEPCAIRINHRQYGDYCDWPDSTVEDCPAADRVYTMQEESQFWTRSAAMKAAHNFLKRFGAGEVEYLEFDVDSQSMIVVSHQPRKSMWWLALDDCPDTPDPLAPHYETPVAA